MIRKVKGWDEKNGPVFRSDGLSGLRIGAELTAEVGEMQVAA
jgi:hypothetical protein